MKSTNEPIINQKRRQLHNALWTSPLIMSAVLPVHAQTSTPSPCSGEVSSFTIPGFTLDCPPADGSPEMTISTAYLVDDSSTCSQSLIAIDNIQNPADLPPGATLDNVLFIVHTLNFEPQDNRFTLGGSVFYNGGDDVIIEHTCGNIDVDQMVAGAFTFLGLSGAEWQADFIINFDEGTEQLSITDIVLTRV